MPRQERNRAPERVALLLAGLLLAAVGCDRGPKLVPIQGRVLYRGQPLPFGSVMFQPAGGLPARGTIGTDGTFRLTTHSAGDGVLPGQSRVRVTCYEHQRPGTSTSAQQQEVGLGRLLIPKRYTSFGTSGLKIEVRADRAEPVTIELHD